MSLILLGQVNFMKSLTLPEFDTVSIHPKVATAGNVSADPYYRFYAIKDKQSLQVRKARRSQTLVWDPWPVTKLQKDAMFDAAMKLVQQRNSQCADIRADKIELLPASGNVLGVQGGSQELSLYSPRSPDTLPVRFHLWHIVGLGTRRNEREGCCTRRRSKIFLATSHIISQFNRTFIDDLSSIYSLYVVCKSLCSKKESLPRL